MVLTLWRDAVGVFYSSGSLGKVGFLWHIKPWCLFKTNPHIYIYIRYEWTVNKWFVINFSNKPMFICSYKGKWFHWNWLTSSPTKEAVSHQHLPPIKKTIKIRRTRHAGHCWRSRDELISDVLLWTPSHARAKAGRSARTYIQQLCVDTGCSPEDLPKEMDDREGWQKRVRDIRADGAT